MTEPGADKPVPGPLLEERDQETGRNDHEPDKTNSSPARYEGVVIHESQVGVYRLLFGSSSGLELNRHLKDIQIAIPLFYRLLSDVYRAAPTLLLLYAGSRMWWGVEKAVMIHLSSGLLRTIERGVIHGAPVAREIVNALIIRVLCTLLAAHVGWWSEEFERRLNIKVNTHFQLYLMKANLNLDIPTTLDPTSRLKVEPDDAWTSLYEIITYCSNFITTIGQLFVIYNTARVTGSPNTVLAICIARPLFTQTFRQSIWDKVCCAFINDANYIRMKALETMVDHHYRLDVISGGLGDWILKGYKKSAEKVGYTSDENPFYQYSKWKSPVYDMVLAVLEDLPMLFCGLTAIIHPARFSIANIAIFQNSSATLGFTISRILGNGDEFRKNISAVKSLYDVEGIQNGVADGVVPYPPTPQTASNEHGCDDLEVPEDNVEEVKGMGFELRDLCFTYPGSKIKSSEKMNVLSHINLSIRPNSLVVIVGANGSGKSTLLKILTRVFDPTSGEICIDGHRASEWKIGDLRRSSVVLSQENTVYPVSLGENIALGWVEAIDEFESEKRSKRKDKDEISTSEGKDLSEVSEKEPNPTSETTAGFSAKLLRLIRDAASKGGASKFIERFEAGYETVLDPMIDVTSLNVYSNHGHPLSETMKELEKEIDISGGERQRLVAARSFMRLNSAKIKFVAVDEPSSALDAEGELDLFNQLLKIREGKTMIFVTHRFGHLTKHADVILCMKDGKIVEEGRHEELIRNAGEYAKLYNIQARAFLEHGDENAEPDEGCVPGEGSDSN